MDRLELTVVEDKDVDLSSRGLLVDIVASMLLVSEWCLGSNDCLRKATKDLDTTPPIPIPSSPGRTDP